MLYKNKNQTTSLVLQEIFEKITLLLFETKLTPLLHHTEQQPLA